MRPIFVLLALVVVPMHPSEAQTSGGYCSTTQNGLCAPSVYESLNPLEQAAASANQRTFDILDPDCNPNSTTGACTADARVVYDTVRELVHTANALSGGLEIEDSLNLDQDALGFALQWTAAEEMAAHGSMTTEFAANQLSALAARIAALRWGVSGLRTAHNATDGRNQVILAENGTSRIGGGASADEEESVARRWGWFMDGAYGYGEKDPTDLEDAFDFDGQEITLGVDYRISAALVAGALLGYSDQSVDFDSSLSIVDGDIESDGYSGQLYLLAEGESGYLSGSLGYQGMSYDVRRRIVYPSFNPNVASTDSTALSSPDSSAFLASLGAGYQFRWGAFAAEPYLDASYVDATIDGFVERSFPTGSPNAAGDPHALRIGKQNLESLNTALGLRLQYVFTPSFGVLIPYLRGAYNFESLDDARRISARYEKALDQLAGDPDSDFRVSTDEPDDDYYTVAVGFSIVLQGGLQGFLQYIDVIDLDNYSQSVISGGMRFEF